MYRTGLRVGVVAATLMFVSGCATFLGDDPEVAQAQRQAEFAEQAKYDQLQVEAERLRSEIDVQQSELDDL